ncbi:MAG: hypothetical protein GX463_04745 [Methanothrix sp.]|nr:hypothetical protein [Methanothrix sp.]
MRPVRSLKDFKELLQAGFESNEESLEAFGKTYSTQLKAYLVESNTPLPDSFGCPLGSWNNIDSSGWYVNRDVEPSNTLFLDSTRDRVWILYSLLDATQSDFIVENWIKSTSNLDSCWLSRGNLLHWENLSGWSRRGMGLRFSDGLSPEESSGNFSLKAWHGANRYVEGLDEILKIAQDKFAIYSVRFQKKSGGSISISAEWYSDGKVTINRAADADEVLISVAEMANRYADSLKEATNLRNKKFAPFEIDFSKRIEDLDAFSATVTKGQGAMKLWLAEIEACQDFRRFKGVDLHTWDRILLDIGPDYVYLTVPGKGCVNAAPRLAVVQGEDNAGRASIYHDGTEVFA